jgi:hypothetical protein
MKREDAREKSISQEVREFLEVTKSNFRVTEVSQWVTKSNRTSNKPILMALSRLRKEGVIEKLDQPGLYRKINTKIESVNIKDVQPGEPLEVKLPFALHHYVNLSPGNMIIFAGVTNSGKSAVIFNMIRENMVRYKCWYFSSEMSSATVKGRLDKYGTDVEWDFEIIDNWDQGIDGIKPDAFNFLDWVEDADAYKISHRLSEIQQKMRRGIVVVALQKNPGNEAAVGGWQTKAKASLYITIDQDYPGAIMRVTKAKAFDEVNPNGFCCRFKIVQGIKLIDTEGWTPEEDKKYGKFGNKK